MGDLEEVLGGPWVRLGVPGGIPGAVLGDKGTSPGGASAAVFDVLKNIGKHVVFVLFWNLGASLEGRGPSSESSKGHAVRHWGFTNSADAAIRFT